MATRYDPEDPRLLRLHAERLVRRDIDQLLAVCEFSLQDGLIDQAEAENILLWLQNHSSSLDTWPASVLYDRLRSMLADGRLDEDEEGELLGLVMSIAKPQTEARREPATLPVDSPQPVIEIPNRSFCFTGVFDFGSRSDCHAALEARGGIPAKSITKSLNYLVIGNVGSDCWRHATFGSKILKAVEYRESGVPLMIVSEGHWVSCLGLP